MASRDEKLYTKLFVTNIPGDITKEYFVQLIQPYAKNGRIIEIKFFKRVVSESCYAFLHFESYIDGEKCMDDLNRRILNGHTMRVGPASKRNPLLSTTNLYIEGVPKEWTDTDLRKHFGEFGEIAAARILVDKGSNASREVGFVHFTNHENALSAMETWQDNKATPSAERPFKIKFANKGRKKDNNHNSNSNDKNDESSGSYMLTTDQYSGGIGPSPYPQSEMNTPRFDEPCRYFQRGNCKRGKNCFYRHGNVVQSGAPSHYSHPTIHPPPQPPPPPHMYPHSIHQPSAAYYQHYYSQYQPQPQPHYQIYPQYTHYATGATAAYPPAQLIQQPLPTQPMAKEEKTNGNKNEISAPNIHTMTHQHQPVNPSYGASRHQTNATTSVRWDPYKAQNAVYGGYYGQLQS